MNAGSAERGMCPYVFDLLSLDHAKQRHKSRDAKPCVFTRHDQPDVERLPKTKVRLHCVCIVSALCPRSAQWQDGMWKPKQREAFSAVVTNEPSEFVGEMRNGGTDRREHGGGPVPRSGMCPNVLNVLFRSHEKTDTQNFASLQFIIHGIPYLFCGLFHVSGTVIVFPGPEETSQTIPRISGDNMYMQM